MGSSDCACHDRQPNPANYRIVPGAGTKANYRIVPGSGKKVKVKKRSKPNLRIVGANKPASKRAVVKPASSSPRPSLVLVAASKPKVGLAAASRTRAPTRGTIAAQRTDSGYRATDRGYRATDSGYRATDPDASTSRVALIASCVSGACSAPTSKLRAVAKQVGENREFARTASRRHLIQGLGLRIAAAAGGDDPGEVMQRAGVSLDDVREASLHVPDVAMLRARFGRVLAFARPLGSFAGYERPVMPWVMMHSLNENREGPPSGGGGSGGGANPAPVDFRPGNWDLDKCEYTIAPGDTMYGLAKTYLGGLGSRWQEIWSLQPWRYEKCPDPSCVEKRGLPTPKVGDKLIMPREACDRARAWAKSGEKPAAPATPGAPAYDNPNKPDPGRPGGGGGGGGGSSSSLPKWAIPAGIAAVAVVGGLTLL